MEHDFFDAPADEHHPVAVAGATVVSRCGWFSFGILINKDMVRRILAHHYQPSPSGTGPSWLTFLGHLKDSLWRIDLFRCESATLRTYSVLVVMDQFTKRIVGFGIHAGIVNGMAVCRGIATTRFG